MRLRFPLVSIALTAALFACNKPGPVANNLVTGNAPVTDNSATPDPAGGAPENASNAAAPSAAQAKSEKIPAALQGRWGLSPADCTTALGYAKGLLVINGDELRFYESRAVPSTNVQTSDNTLNGDFHFTGEGQTWDKFESLQRRGHKLTRTESDPTASYTYAKC
jgi:hypothetical protein